MKKTKNTIFIGCYPTHFNTDNNITKLFFIFSDNEPTGETSEERGKLVFQGNGIIYILCQSTPTRPP